jgi:hypothetical protein
MMQNTHTHTHSVHEEYVRARVGESFARLFVKILVV